jgi:hypothetical protein
VLVAHACNPNYSGGRDQEDQFKASPGKWFARTYLKKNSSQKRVMAQGVGLEFKP